MTATTADETPLYFPLRDDHLFGVLTAPTGQPNGAGLLLVYDAGFKMSAHRNRVWTRLARAAAGGGFRSLRFDHRGSGDATGELSGYSLDDPFVDDVVAAAGVLRSAGAQRIVLIGTCVGARAALEAATLLPDLAAVSLASLAVRPIPEINPAGGAGEVPARLVTALDDLGERGVPVQLVYGLADRSYEVFFDAAAQPPLVAALPAVTVERVPGPLHGFGTLDGQRRYLDTVLAWLSSLESENPSHMLDKSRDS